MAFHFQEALIDFALYRSRMALHIGLQYAWQDAILQKQRAARRSLTKSATYSHQPGRGKRNEGPSTRLDTDIQA